jgi:hypothetical protein
VKREKLPPIAGEGPLGAVLRRLHTLPRDRRIDVEQHRQVPGELLADAL